MTRLLRLLLRLYPRAFRERLGDELMRAWRDRHNDDVERLGYVRAWARSLVDLFDIIAAGVAERFRAFRADTHRSPSYSAPHTHTEDARMARFWKDLRFALRTLRKQPGFVAAVVLTVALGVGANTATFSVVHAVLLRQLPYEEPEELVFVFQTDRFNDTRREGTSAPDYFDYLERQTVFERLAAYTGAPNPTLTPEGREPERLTALQVTHTLFPTLGWEAVRGRTFVPEEDKPGGPAVAVLSHGLWVRGFGGDPSIIGGSIYLDGNAYTVVGVMPADFRFGGSPDLWLPLQFGPTSTARGQHTLAVIGRLKEGETKNTAQQEMSAIMAALEEEYPDDNVGRGANVEAMTQVVTGDVRPALLMLMGAVGLVLLIACVNVANLLFTRGTARRREVAVRAAMGASRGRLMTQFLAESLILAAAGGALGVALAFGALELLRDLGPAALPRVETISLSGPVLIFALGITMGTGIIFGILPAVRAAATSVSDDLGEGGRTSASAATGRTRSALVVTQVTLAFVLTVGAGLLVRSMWNLTRVDPGFRYDNLMRLSISLPQARYPNDFRDWPDVPEVLRFHAEVVERAERLPYVSRAALALNPPTAPGWTTRVAIEGGPSSVEEGIEEERIRPVSAGYFATAGIPLLRGRDFSRRDDGQAPMVAVVNEAFVEKYFPATNPIGKRFQFWGRSCEIVGVVGDVKFMGIDQADRPAFYVPLTQIPFSQFDIIIRSAASGSQVFGAMRAQIHQIDPELAVFNAASFESMLSEAIAPQRFNLMMFGLFAGLALALAAVGIYGVIAYGVSRRAHEFGVRMSLGADGGRIVQLVLSQGGRLVGLGILLGILCALAASRLISGMLFDVAPIDPVTLAAVAGILAAVALWATLLPALRAGRVNPVVALRDHPR